MSYKPSSSNEIIIKAISDFPAAAGGVITLLENKTYLIDNNINMGTTRIVMQHQTVLRGVNTVSSGFIYTGTGVFISATDARTTIDDLVIVATDTTTAEVFNHTNTIPTTTHADKVHTSNSVNWVGGNIAIRHIGSSISLYERCAFVNQKTTACMYSGTATNVALIQNQFVNPTTGTNLTGIDVNSITAGTLKLFSISNNQFYPTTGGTFINMNSEAMYAAGGFGKVEGNNYIPAGSSTFVTSVDSAATIYTTFYRNSASQDTRTGIAQDLSAQTITTMGSQWDGVSATTNVSLANGTFAPYDQYRFTGLTTAGGRCTYTGNDIIGCQIMASFSAQANSGNGKGYIWFIRKNGNTIITASKVSVTADSSKIDSVVTLAQLAQVQTGDYFELCVASLDATPTDVWVRSLTLAISKIGA